DPALVLQEATMNSIEFIALHCETGPTSDIRVRQAMALATDKNELIMAAYRGKATPAHSFLGSVMQNLIDVDPDMNPENARLLMSEAGYSDGVDLTMICTGTRHQLIAQVLQAQWKKIGIRLDIQPLESSSLNERIKSGDFQVYLSSSNSSNDEPLEFLEECASQFGVGNRTRFSDTQYDELYTVITSTLEEPTRGNAIEEMQRIIADKVPFIPLAYPIDAQGIKKSVGGLNLNIGRETIWYNIYKIE
ncbi:MAG: ABC transporter substrate-binding protein, partial [Ruminococcus flavefaciens]